MNINKDEFLEVLSILKRSVGKIDPFREIMFRDGHAYSFDGHIFQQEKFDIGFEGAIIGDTLVNYLKVLKYDDVHVSLSKESLMFRKANDKRVSKVKIPFKDKEDLVLKPVFRIRGNTIELKVTEELVSAIEFVMISANDRNIAIEMVGVQVKFEDGDVVLSSIDSGQSLSRAVVSNLLVDDFNPVILSTDFCKLVIKQKDNARLVLSKDRAYLLKGNDILSYGMYPMVGSKVFDYDAAIDMNLEVIEKEDLYWYEVSDEVLQAFEICGSLQPESARNKTVIIKAEGKELIVSLNSQDIKYDDRLSPKIIKGVSEVSHEVYVHIMWLLKAIEVCKYFSIGDRSIVFRNKNRDRLNLVSIRKL